MAILVSIELMRFSCVSAGMDTGMKDSTAEYKVSSIRYKLNLSSFTLGQYSPMKPIYEARLGKESVWYLSDAAIQM